MTGDDDDDLVKTYRGLLLEQPGRALDQKILRAARAARLRNRMLPVALAMAASLALAWIASWHAAGPGAPRYRIVTHDVIPGLYEGRIAHELADPVMTQQSIARHMPGGMEGEANHGS